MKTVLAAFLVMVCTLANAQSTVASSYYGKLTSYSLENPNPYAPAPGLKMKRTGTTLTVLGGVLLVGGVVLASTADALYYNSNTTNGNTTESGDIKGGVGVVMIAGGVGMLVPGIIFMSKGTKKYNAYKAQQQQKTLSIGLGRNGLGLRYSF